MKRYRTFAAPFAAVALLACALPQPREASAPASLKAPVAAIKPFEVKSPNGSRTDNYYWLRDDTRKSPEVLGYLQAEDDYWRASMAHAQKLEDRLYDDIVARVKEDDASPPTLDHGYWYYTRFEKGKEYPIYARRKGTMDAPEEIMLDGPALAKGKAFFNIGETQVSPDGHLLAYAEDDVGRRQYVMHVKDLTTGQTLPDTVANIEPDLAWASDNKTLLYVEKDPETLLSVRVHKHTLGDSSDPLVYEEKDHSFYMSVARSKTDKYLYITEQSTLVSETRYADAADPQLKFKLVLPREAKHEYEVNDVGSDFIIRTNWKAKNFRLMRAPIATSADKRTWKDVVPAGKDRFIEGFDTFHDYLAFNERTDGLLKVRILPWAKGGKSFQIAAEEPTYVNYLIAQPEFSSDWLRYSYSSLTTPSTVFDYNMRTGEKKLVKRQPVLGGFDQDDYTEELVHAPARDGTQVPVSLVYRKGFKKDGTAPLYQYGYGSYGISMDPRFSLSMVSLVDRGFVYAIAHIRGGQELGRDWYENGKLLHKMNTFTDFIDVTRYLVKEGYAAKDKVFAAGGSAGGLLMGAVSNLAPQDYRGIVTKVPFVDVVTTMLDESIPLTTNEFDEWGNPKKKKYYDYMLTYSPYDNVKAQPYPAMFVSTGLWDSQVQYYEPAKYVAKLRALKTDRHPLYFHVNMEAGHGGRSGRYQVYREIAQEFAFVLDRLEAAD